MNRCVEKVVDAELKDHCFLLVVDGLQTFVNRGMYITGKAQEESFMRHKRHHRQQILMFCDWTYLLNGT